MCPAVPSIFSPAAATSGSTPATVSVFFYVNERHAGNHPAVGWRSARDPYALVSDELDLTPDARAMEAGHPPFPNVFTLGAALGLQHELGAAVIESRVLQLSGLLRKVLIDAGLPVPTSDRPGATSSGALRRRGGPPGCARRTRRAGIGSRRRHPRVGSPLQR